jgi:hypothetical protein
MPSRPSRWDGTSEDQRRQGTSKARERQQQNAALRALDDPVKLAQAARVVRAALERRKLTVSDLLPEPEQQAS